MAQRNLDVEDQVRALRGEFELAKVLQSSEPFRWFVALVEAEIESGRLDIERATEDRLMNRRVGYVLGLRAALGLVERRSSTLKSDLQARGAR